MASRARNRVLIIVENLPVPFDRRVWMEANSLREAGYDVTVICPKMKGFTASRETINGIAIFRHPLPLEGSYGALGFLIEYGIAFFWEFLLAWRVFLTRGFDIIHACNPPDNICLIGIMFKLFGVRFVFDQHDINPELYIAKYGKKGPLYFVLLWFERLSFATANLIISTNESYRKIALDRGKRRPETVHVVRSAPDISKFRAVAPEPALKQGFANLVVYLGVMGKQEGVDLLINAIARIVKEGRRTDTLFVLVGSGPEHAAMQQFVNSLSLERYVIFTGRISDEDLLRYLSTADVCVNPDRVNEMNDKSTMNKIMEYMAIGKPIVQFETTEGRYSARDSSLYARPNDSQDFADRICALLDDPAARKAMGDYGRLRMENELDWRFSRAALLRAYKSIE